MFNFFSKPNSPEEELERARELLEKYLKMADQELSDWVKLALHECKMFSKAKPGQIVKIFH